MQEVVAHLSCSCDAMRVPYAQRRVDEKTQMCCSMKSFQRFASMHRSSAFWIDEKCLRSSCCTAGIHSFFGRPILRTYLSVPGRVESGMKEARRRRLCSGALTIFPYKQHCLRSNRSLALVWPARRKTSALDILDMYAALMPRMLRINRFCTPSRRR